MTTVALDWDKEAAHVAVAERRPGGVRLVRAATIDAGDDAAALAERLRAALPDIRWSRAKIVAALGGDRVAFRLLKLPPTPDQELADMVGLLAEKEFGAGDEGVVDYVPLSGDADSPRTALAARVRRSTLDRLSDLAAALDASASRAVVRGCEAAAVAARLDPTLARGASLVTAPAAGGSDLVVLADGVPAIVRTTPGALTADSSEVRRTLPSASLQLGRKVQRVASIGAGGEAIAALAADGLTPEERALAESMPGVVGAAIAEAEDRAADFDFLAPRKPTTQHPGRRRQLMLAGLTAAVVLLGIFQGYLNLKRYETQRADIDAQTKATQERTSQFEPKAADAEAIEQWLATDVNWLDEIDLLGRELRPKPLDDKTFAADDDVMLLQVTATASSGGSAVGGQLSLDAVARDADTPTLLEQRLSDDRREVRQGTLDRSGTRPYVWRFKPTLKISRSAADSDVEPAAGGRDAEGDAEGDARP
ncbi:MAG: hypothetical protein AAGB00_05840 [Planctomycetota bacterium]